MARYDYRCTACGNVFEVEHGMTEHPEVTCPACGEPASKVFSASGISFQGTGFYNTDQRGGSSSTEATSGPSESASTSSEGSSTGSGSSSCGCENCPHKDA